MSQIMWFNKIIAWRRSCKLIPWSWSEGEREQQVERCFWARHHSTSALADSFPSDGILRENSHQHHVTHTSWIFCVHACNIHRNVLMHILFTAHLFVLLWFCGFVMCHHCNARLPVPQIQAGVGGRLGLVGEWSQDR